MNACLADNSPSRTPDAFTFVGTGFSDTNLNHNFDLWGQAPPPPNSCGGALGIDCSANVSCCVWKYVACNITITLTYIHASTCDQAVLTVQTATDTWDYIRSDGCGQFTCQAGESMTFALYDHPTGTGTAPASLTIRVSGDASFCGGCCPSHPGNTLTGTVTSAPGCPALLGKTVTLTYTQCYFHTESDCYGYTTYSNAPVWHGTLSCGGDTASLELTCTGGGSPSGWCFGDDGSVLGGGALQVSAACSPFRLVFRFNNVTFCGCTFGNPGFEVTITP